MSSRLPETTVTAQVGRILAKLGRHDLAEAVILAYRTGSVALSGRSPGPGSGVR